MALQFGPRGQPDPEFAAFYQRNRAIVWASLARSGVGLAAREDLLQATFIKAHEKRHTRGEAPEAAWLRSIAWREAANYRRLARHRIEEGVDDYDLPPQSGTQSTEDSVGDRRWYLRLIEHVSEDRREVFEMHELEGFSVPEIAATLGENETTIYGRLRYAREEIHAAAKRMAVRDSRAAIPPMLAFGFGAWKIVDSLVGEMPNDVGARAWRGIQRVAEGGAVAASVGAGGAAAVAHSAVVAAAFGHGVLWGGVGGAIIGGAVATAALTTLHGREAHMVQVLPDPLTAKPAISVASPMTTASTALATPARPGGVAGVGSVTTAPSAATDRAPSGTALDPEEERLIHQAEAAITAHERATALAAINEHARRFPRGLLAAERERLRTKLLAGGREPVETPDPAARPGAPREQPFGD